MKRKKYEFLHQFINWIHQTSDKISQEKKRDDNTIASERAKEKTANGRKQMINTESERIRVRGFTSISRKFTTVTERIQLYEEWDRDQ